MKCKEKAVFYLLTLKHWLGNPFWRFQKFIFGLFILGSLGNFLIYVFTKKTLLQELRFFINVLLIWLGFSVVTTFIWILGRIFINLDLYLYYSLYIKLFARFFYKINPLKYQRYNDISDSFKMNPQYKLPTFIKREHLMRNKYWPNWVFSIIAILDPNKIKQRIIEHNSKKEWILEVDLRNESYGIYSNGGKKFLASKYFTASHSEQTLSQSHNFLENLKPSAKIGKEIFWGEVGEGMPIRWASGGMFSFVRFKGKTWAQLFFRDINPIGLNIANGASEEKREYKDLHYLIAREFSEETILLSSNPKAGSIVNQKVFVAYSNDPNTDSDMAKYYHRKFIEQHTNLRWIHDNIHIQSLNNITRTITPINTPFSVKVIFHKSDHSTTEEKQIHNVIYSLNPSEFGIEVIRIAHFNLKDDECLLDGEFHLSRKVLIRRPVVLIDMKYIEDIFTSNKSLGKLIKTDLQFECKMMDPIPKDNCYVFIPDIELRQQRLERIKEELATKKLTKKSRENLLWESELITNWIKKYKYAFQNASDNGIQNENLRTLCPVTWKTLEIILSHGIKI